MKNKLDVLDKGYIKYIGHMGSDETVIEAARMSSGKGFLGWYWEKDTYADAICATCSTQHLMGDLPVEQADGGEWKPVCTNCWSDEVRLLDPAMDKLKLLGKEGQPKDLGLLEYLYSNKHMTPFEMGEVCFEIYAPLFVFREWQRHRTQSYNEFSARYSIMPSVHYVPDLDRFQKQSKANKQGSGEPFTEEQATLLRNKLQYEQGSVYGTYQDLLDKGLAKEVARVNTPVSRYSKMRAKTDLRNWLAFLSLRMEMSAQWEIRQYANAVASMINVLFPKTFQLFIEHDFMGERFSRSEMKVLRSLLSHIPAWDKAAYADMDLSERAIKSFVKKLTNDKEKVYEDVLTNLGVK